MTARFISVLSAIISAAHVAAQSVDVVRPENQQKARRAVVKDKENRAKQTSIIEFRGQQALNEKELRVAIKEEITTVEDFGLSPARADDLAFFLEVFYRKHGYARVDVHYVIESGGRLRLDINEGPRFLLSQVIFDGNAHEPGDKLFEYMVGPTRERYSRAEKRLPFVAADLEEGTHLVQRFYVAEGFLNAVVDPPSDKFLTDSSDVDVVVPIHEGRQYFFGSITFNVRHIKPVVVDGHLLRLDISAEEAKSKELGFWVGFDTYEGALAGVQVGDRDLFGYGRPLTATIEVSQRSYRGEILYEDPFFFDTDFVFTARAFALTFDYDGYSKFELGGRFELSRKITKYDEASLTFSARHVKITDSEIKPTFLLGPEDYQVDTIGVTNTLDLRESPYVNPRGFLVGNTLDVASSALGSDIEFIRGTMRVGYYLPFGPKPLTPGVVEDQPAGTPLQHWFQQSSIAFGARGGVINSLTESGSDEATAIPIDERFFNGGATTVRSFAERDLGPHDNHGHPVGGEFFTVFNVEYTFPIFGELQGAVFTDAGNLLPTSEDIGLNNMRYAVGAGLRYKLPVGPIRLDYGINPDPHQFEDFGAFHFSFGFAF